MASYKLLAGSTIRTPSYTLLVRPDGSLRTLREGDKTWKGNKLPSWTDFDAFLAEKAPAWWQIEFKYPKGWFDEANRLYRAGQSYESTLGAANVKFRAEIISPFVMEFGMKKAPDQFAWLNLYGTEGSPASKTAEQQLREVEPDPAKWPILWLNVKDEKERKRLMDLAERWRRFGGGASPAPVPPAPVPPAPSPPVPQALPPSDRKAHILRLAQEKGVAHMISFEPDGRDRKFYVHDRSAGTGHHPLTYAERDDWDETLCAEAHSLSFDTVFATIYMRDGGCSNHYMPLNDFLELYTH
jgi:hypothetical protein